MLLLSPLRKFVDIKNDVNNKQKIIFDAIYQNEHIKNAHSNLQLGEAGEMIYVAVTEYKSVDVNRYCHPYDQSCDFCGEHHKACKMDFDRFMYHEDDIWKAKFHLCRKNFCKERIIISNNIINNFAILNCRDDNNAFNNVPRDIIKYIGYILIHNFR